MALAHKGHKIQADHLERQALIYIRQSSLTQVKENVGSKERQYDLVNRAQDLGWAKEQIVVVDQDQGRSGASAEGRDGFQYLVAEVGMGQVGAVFSLEVSRLARSCIDWYRLLEICALMQTLVVDEEGVYDPSNYNDRLLLGFKGTMSEAELHWLHSRLMGGRMKKAESGQLWLLLPTGLVYNEGKEIILDVDEEVQQALRLLFEVYEEVGTAMGVVRYFRDHELRFPTRALRGPNKGDLSWGRLSRSRVLSVLHNPLYAGAYAYGRSEQRVQTRPGESRPVKRIVRHAKPEDWKVLIVDAHPGYISWERYLRNQQQLKDNHSDWGAGRGAVREGMALLQGIVVCGKCGRRMTVRYIEDGKTPVYRCRAANHQYGEPTCQTIRGNRIDAKVSDLFLEVMTPAQMSVSLQAMEQIEVRTRQIEQQWKLRIERAGYEADLARRRYCAVDPENRLVVRNLERDWNEKLAKVERLEREYDTRPKPSRLIANSEERERILNLAGDLQSVWNAATTTNAERKQLLRCLLQDITLTQGEDDIHVGVRWQTEALSDFKVPRPKPIYETQCTAAAVIDCVRELASTHTDIQIAKMLNDEGHTTGVGLTFTRRRVHRVRVKYEIPTGCPEMPIANMNGQRGDGRYSSKTAAKLLNVSIGAISQWSKSGKLDSIQAVPGAPRWIKLTPDIIAKLRRSERQSRRAITK
ncbi:MAG: recombinase family protein [Anaerolineales bacterium]|uniref:Recombinase family protein n=1 Tax=Candidatus Desulfolinea nitratireducens TaxID=2841698 RepID=A0A8J6NS28_9CHLR|nr:recombinase family protein [Candidatus Desulfolinea nitratireducens]